MHPQQSRPGLPAWGPRARHPVPSRAQLQRHRSVHGDADGHRRRRGTGDRQRLDVESGLYCGTATNSSHADAGRTHNSGGCYYAEGSDTYLGCMGTSETTLSETSTGHFEEVSSCDGSGDGGDDGSWWNW